MYLDLIEQIKDFFVIVFIYMHKNSIKLQKRHTNNDEHQRTNTPRTLGHNKA